MENGVERMHTMLSLQEVLPDVYDDLGLLSIADESLAILAQMGLKQGEYPNEGPGYPAFKTYEFVPVAGDAEDYRAVMLHVSNDGEAKLIMTGKPANKISQDAGLMEFSNFALGQALAGKCGQLPGRVLIFLISDGPLPIETKDMGLPKAPRLH